MALFAVRRSAVLMAVTAVTAGGLVSFAAQPVAASPPASPTASPAPSAASRLDGYTAASSARERAAEQQFLTYPSATLARQLDQELAAKPGMVGTPTDHARARKIVAKLRSFGLHPHVSKYYVYMSTPRKVSVQLTSPVHFTARNKERCRKVETDCKDVVVGYNALSPSGNVTAPVVYVNYGTTEDYATLARKGISVKGKIVLVRYGQVFRGVKTNLAAEHGAKAAILYSDPADDGKTRGPVYPKGPWRAPDGIQRGSVQQLWKYSGDPLTPGRPATKHAKRISPKHSNIAKIPTTPIGYGSAKPILAHLGGAAAPKSWQGGLPMTYRLGSGSTVHLNLKISYRIRPVYDITASITGRTHPKEVVQLGAHHDSWVYGSDDNLSGAEAVLQIGRGLAQLVKTGWRPERTIEIGTWDGEEYGLFGSTEYAEAAGKSRLGHVVTYLNMDGAGGKYFGAASVPSLDKVIRDVAKQVSWPGTSGTAYDNWAQSTGAKTPTPERLGSGSDYTAFIDHFGVPSASLGSGTDSGNYHCSCDNFYMEDHFIDPGWRYHVSTAQVVGLAVLRLADADVVPLHYGPYATEVVSYLKQLSAQQDQVLGRRVVRLQRDRAQARRWATAARALDRRTAAALAAGHTAGLDAVTRRLERVERQLLVSRGLPGRKWFKHQIYAPGVNQGYGTQELPGINDALFLHDNAAQGRSYERSLHKSLRAVTKTLRQA
jgi:peptidase M28-like protein/transferrin receptor-like protein/PA domain-containing protein